jgi:hypothetical protein
VLGSGKVGGWVLDVAEHPATDLKVAVPIFPISSDWIEWPPENALPDATQLGHFAKMVIPNRGS